MKWLKLSLELIVQRKKNGIRFIKMTLINSNRSNYFNRWKKLEMSRDTHYLIRKANTETF
jgi:hypothetical protein